MTQATFLRDPDARRIFLAEIAMRRRFPAASWAADGTYTNCWKVTWPHPHELPTSVREYNTSYTTLTERASATLCNNNDASWFYDEATATLYINPTGAPSPLVFRYLVTYVLRLSTEDVAFTIGGRAEQYFGSLLTDFVINREAAYLDGVANAGAGQLTIKDDDNLDLFERYQNEIFINSVITIWVGGEDHLGSALTHTGSDSGGAGTTYAKLWTGYLTSGINAYGTVEWDRAREQLTIPMADEMSLYSLMLPYSASSFNGRPDEIINAALTEASLTTATIETAGADDLGVGVAAAIDYHCSLMRPEEMSVMDIIRACAAHLLIYYIDRAGTPRITYWKLPAAQGEEVATFNTDYDPTAYTRQTDYARWHSAVTVYLGRGRDGAPRVNRANREKVATQGDDRSRVAETFTSDGGWTQRGSFNVWDRPYSKKPVAVIEGGVEYKDAGNSFNACDTDNLSFAFVNKDDVASGDPNRLCINPPSDPTALTIQVWYERQNNRTTESVSGAKDVAVKTAEKVEAKSSVGKTKPYVVHSLITHATDAQDFADDLLALVQTPLDTSVLETSIADVANIEIGDTIRLEDEDGNGEQFRVRALSERWGAGRLTITAWKPHAGTTW